VIVVIIGTCCSATAIKDSSGLNFTQRISYASEIWEFYALATSPLKSDNISVVGNPLRGTIFGMQVFAVHGANTLAIFDQNPSIPATCSGSACGDCEAYIEATSCSVSIQTSTIDFVIATTAISDAGSCGLGYPRGVVPGFTNITNEHNRFEVDYAITTAPQSNVVFSCNATDATAIVVDAISFYGAFGT